MSRTISGTFLQGVGIICEEYCPPCNHCTPSIFEGLSGWPCRVKCMFTGVGNPTGFPPAPNGFEFILDVNDPDCADIIENGETVCINGYCFGGCRKKIANSGPEYWIIALTWHCFAPIGPVGADLYLRYMYDGDPPVMAKDYFIDYAANCAVNFLNGMSYGGSAEINLAGCGNYCIMPVWEGTHAGMVALTIEDDDNPICNDTFYGEWNSTMTKFTIEIPDDCCEKKGCKISGRVTKNGVGVEGVSMNGLNAVTDSDGYYTFYVPKGWSGTVTPLKSGNSIPTPISWEVVPYETGSGQNCQCHMEAAVANGGCYSYDFSPTHRDYSNVNSDQENQDYEATGGGGVEYYFECSTNSSINSGWQTSRTWNVPVGNCGQGLKFHFKARCGVDKVSGWSTALPCYP
ncbi:MAG: hypothetical protein ABSG99_02650 [Sedimentisphaerales bacterium]